MLSSELTKVDARTVEPAAYNFDRAPHRESVLQKAIKRRWVGVWAAAALAKTLKIPISFASAAATVEYVSLGTRARA